MPAQLASDADFYELVHYMLHESDAEQRTEVRRPYQCVQRIAPIHHGELPKGNMFAEVECCDLSPGGVSFYTPAMPDYDGLVIALGTPEQPLYVTAEVVNTESRVENNRAVCRVNCRFTGRLAVTRL